MPHQAIVFEGPSAARELAALGLDPQWLIETVLTGEVERRNTSSLEPSGAPGSRCWFASVRALTERVLMGGGGAWARIERRGWPLVVNKENRVAVAICAGDHNVGRAAHSPRSRNSKGTMSLAATSTNAEQLPLFDGPLRFRPVPRRQERVTWWLLSFADAITGEVRAELSLPLGVDDARHLSTWQRRIILDIPRDESWPRRDDDQGDALAFNLAVRPRG